MLLQEKLKKYTVILGSGSPRRQQFLKELQLDFTIQLKDIDEVFPKELKKEEITNYLAKLKAGAFGILKDNEIVITADTIVWHKGKMLGKPKDTRDAQLMLLSLSGKKHTVYSSVCIKSKHREVVFSDATTVYFDHLSQHEINYYVNEFKPYDKAGSYGIQEWIGLVGVKKIKGSYFNVMGFPVHKFYKEMMAFVD